MLTVISPAKTLDFESQPITTCHTQPKFLAQSQALIDELRELSAPGIASLMKLSDKLAGLNMARFQTWTTPFSLDNSKQAVLAFKGDVYSGLDAETMDDDGLEFAQQHLRILSGLDGVFKPLDLIQPYRLEMGTKLKRGRADNLYQYWGTKLTDTLNEELEEGELFINLASNEYFKAIKPKALKVPVITPVFKDLKNGKLKVISFFAKKARGLMVRYIIDTNAQTLDDLKGFNYEGYSFSEEHSNTDKNELVFIR
jgi:cytoplasmic iron level regulating protein YaaA (DUF328/UPF0246 family)